MRQTARSVALEAIRRVVDEGAYSTIVVPLPCGSRKLDVRDRAFATDLAFGTIRHLRSIDWALDRVATRPVARMSSGRARRASPRRLQVLFTDAAPHAAVGETVGLARDRERGFVNAVLRRLAAEPSRGPEGSAPTEVSIRTGLAPWAVDELARLLPAEEVEPAAAAFATHAPLCLRVNTDMISVEGFIEAMREDGREPRPAALDPTCVLVDGGDPSVLPGVRRRMVRDPGPGVGVRRASPRSSTR